MRPHRPSEHPWVPPPLERPEIFALKALVAGKASESQQVTALHVIINKICGTYDMSFRPGGDESARATDFAEGKRFVGTQIVRALNMVLESGEKDDATRSPGRQRPAKRRRKPRSAAGDAAGE